MHIFLPTSLVLFETEQFQAKSTESSKVLHGLMQGLTNFSKLL